METRESRVGWRQESRDTPQKDHTRDTRQKDHTKAHKPPSQTCTLKCVIGQKAQHQHWLVGAVVIDTGAILAVRNAGGAAEHDDFDASTLLDCQVSPAERRDQCALTVITRESLPKHAHAHAHAPALARESTCTQTHADADAQRGWQRPMCDVDETSVTSDRLQLLSEVHRKLEHLLCVG